MNTSLARRLDAAAIIVGLGFGALATAEPRRAEELEQLRINTAYPIESGEFEIDIVPSYFDYGDAHHHGVEAESSSTRSRSGSWWNSRFLITG
jgi:hypothetical protein